MGSVFLILIIAGFLLSALSGVVALRAWLRFRRARLELQARLSKDVAALAARTSELEASLAALDARYQQLPVRISHLQENLSNLQVLTRTLAVSLKQAQRVLSYSWLKTFSAARLSNLIPNRLGGSDFRKSL